MTDLATLSDVKAWLSLDATLTGDDDLLATLIAAASDHIETLCSRHFALAAYTETRDGTGGIPMATRQYPIAAVSGVTIDGRAVLADGYRFTETLLILTGGRRFRRGFGNVVASYSAGYAVIPAALARAATELAAWQYREGSRIGQASVAMAGETTSFVAAALPPRVAAIVAQYKRVAP
jgi:hypothetical protein